MGRDDRRLRRRPGMTTAAASDRAAARELDEQRAAASTTAAERSPHGRQVRVGGLVVARQRPGTAKGIVFMLHRGRRRHRQPDRAPGVYERTG